jgi:hypothetical protein
VVIRSKFDDAGRLVDERFVDAAGAPRPAAVSTYAPHGTRHAASIVDSIERA